jgi:hypothetical protein
MREAFLPRAAYFCEVKPGRTCINLVESRRLPGKSGGSPERHRCGCSRGNREADRQGMPRLRARKSPARRKPDQFRPGALFDVRRGSCRTHCRGQVRSDGRVSAFGDGFGDDHRGGRSAETRPSRRRPGAHGAGARHLLRRLKEPTAKTAKIAKTPSFLRGLGGLRGFLIWRAPRSRSSAHNPGSTGRRKTCPSGPCSGSKRGSTRAHSATAC